MIPYDHELRERLRANLAAFEPRTHPLDGRRHAAVSVIVLDSDAELHGVDTTWWSLPEEERGTRLDMVPGLPPDHGLNGSVDGTAGGAAFMLTRRAQKMSAHPGQWAFPGGRVDEGDAFAGDECVVPKLFTLMLDSARCVHRQRHDTAVLPASRCGPTARLDPRRASR